MKTLARFQEYYGDLMGLPTDEKHINFRWMEPDCKVLFSMSQQGQALSCHFASDKAGMKKIHQAIEETAEFLFWACPWCRMILAKIQIPKIKKLIEECGFVLIATTKNYDLYMRSR